MTNEPNGEEPEENTDGGGRSLAIGIVAGTVLFALTDNPVWIAIGVAIGASLAAKDRAAN